MYSCDKYARQKLLGETDLKLGDIDLRQPLRVWMNLRDLDEVKHQCSNYSLLLSSLLFSYSLVASLAIVLEFALNSSDVSIIILTWL